MRYTADIVPQILEKAQLELKEVQRKLKELEAAKSTVKQLTDEHHAKEEVSNALCASYYTSISRLEKLVRMWDMAVLVYKW